MGQQFQLRHPLQQQHVLGHRPDQGRGGHEHQLHLVGQLLGGAQHRPVEPAAGLLVEGAQRHEDPAPLRVEPLPGETGRVGSGPEGRADEGVVRREVVHRADEFGGREDQDEAFGEPRVPARPVRPLRSRRPVRRVRGEEPGDLPVDPLPDLREVRERPGQLGGRARGGGPGNPEPARDHRPGEGLLIGDHQVRCEAADRIRHPRHHRPGQRHQRLLPQEAQRPHPAQIAPAVVQRRITAARLLAGRQDPGVRGQQPGQRAGRPGPGDLVSPGGEFGPEGHGRIDVPGQRRHREEDPHGTSAPARAAVTTAVASR